MRGTRCVPIFKSLKVKITKTAKRTESGVICKPRCISLDVQGLCPRPCSHLALLREWFRLHSKIFRQKYVCVYMYIILISNSKFWILISRFFVYHFAMMDFDASNSRYSEGVVWQSKKILKNGYRPGSPFGLETKPLNLLHEFGEDLTDSPHPQKSWTHSRLWPYPPRTSWVFPLCLEDLTAFPWDLLDEWCPRTADLQRTDSRGPIVPIDKCPRRVWPYKLLEVWTQYRLLLSFLGGTGYFS